MSKMMSFMHKRGFHKSDLLAKSAVILSDWLVEHLAAGNLNGQCSNRKRFLSCRENLTNGCHTLVKLLIFKTGCGRPTEDVLR